ncbi:MAG: translational GTPase TypA [bacterium]
MPPATTAKPHVRKHRKPAALLREDVRNIAIIAHVDHGKTTLVDCMLKQTGIFRDNQTVGELILDSNDLERERGITIYAKNTAIKFHGITINIIDTPGHADFGGEVERVLRMVDGVLLLVDAVDGPMLQTKFVLTKSLELNLKPIVVINKIDRPNTRIDQVINAVFDLFVDLGANDDQLDFPIVYASAKEGYATTDLKKPSTNIDPLLETIIKKVPLPPGDIKSPFQMQVMTIDYNDYLGRMAIGRIYRGKINTSDMVAQVRLDGTIIQSKVTKLYGYLGLGKTEIESAQAGDIVALAGLDSVEIGETIAHPETPEALPGIIVEEPTLEMNFLVNTSPFAGTEGTYVTSRNLRERLEKELQSNVALRVEFPENADVFLVKGRGELHLSILIETMRRQGYEFAVSKPQAVFKEIDGKKMEPIEQLFIDVPEDYLGLVMEKLGRRKAQMANMHHDGSGSVRLEFTIPARGLIGFQTEFVMDTRGTGIMHHSFLKYDEYQGDIQTRITGSLIAKEPGLATAYALENLQERSTLFVEPGDKIYEGMVVGENSRENDMVVNPCKKKHLTNMRSSTSDEAIQLKTIHRMTLEESIEFIKEDELVEITPKSLRLRKRILAELARRREFRGIQT